MINVEFMTYLVLDYSIDCVWVSAILGNISLDITLSIL